MSRLTEYPSRAVISLALILAVSSCGSALEAPDAPFRARLLISTDSGYRLQTATFSTLTDVDSVSGTVAKLIGGASIDVEAEIDEIINPSTAGDLYIDPGHAPRINYVIKNGVIYPRNYASLEMLNVYYQYETSILFWRDHLDLDLADFGKLRLLYAPTIGVDRPEASIAQTPKINAAFFPGPRDFLFFKTSRLEEVPINLNLAVVAHEFGHAIVDYKFAKKDPSVYFDASETADVELRGINEGISDFFAYMVTQREDEFQQSLSKLMADRTLPVAWTYSTLSDSGCGGGPYCKGSILASALFEITSSTNKTAVEVGRIVYEALVPFRDEWDSNKLSDEFDYHLFIKHIVSGFETSEQAGVCEVFERWFDVPAVSSNMGCP